MMRRDVISAALCAHKNACTFPHYTEDQRLSARSALRDLMIQLDLYEDFLEELGITPTRRRGDAVS